MKALWKFLGCCGKDGGRGDGLPPLMAGPLGLLGEEAGNRAGKSASSQHHPPWFITESQLLCPGEWTPWDRLPLEVNFSGIHLVLLPGTDAFLWRETEAGRELYFLSELEPASVIVQVRKLRHRECV